VMREVEVTCPNVGSGLSKSLLRGFLEAWNDGSLFHFVRYLRELY
jgi:hypothetical protein